MENKHKESLERPDFSTCHAKESRDSTNRLSVFLCADKSIDADWEKAVKGRYQRDFT